MVFLRVRRALLCVSQMVGKTYIQKFCTSREHFIELPQKLASFFAINIMHLILAETYFRLQKVPVLILTGKYHQGTEEDCPSIEIW